MQVCRGPVTKQRNEAGFLVERRPSVTYSDGKPEGETTLAFFSQGAVKFGCYTLGTCVCAVHCAGERHWVYIRSHEGKTTSQLVINLRPILRRTL